MSVDVFIHPGHVRSKFVLFNNLPKINTCATKFCKKKNSELLNTNRKQLICFSYSHDHAVSTEVQDLYCGE